jgi:hypothetical protein
MDKPSVYIETSIVSYLAADPSRHPVTLRNQQLTHAWWATRERYALYTSKLVIDEAADGNPVLAQRRLALLSGVPLIGFAETDAEQLAADLCMRVPMPAQAYTDAMHIALAAARGMTYVLTWNCKHIANPRLQSRIRAACSRWGYQLPALCTPADLK